LTTSQRLNTAFKLIAPVAGALAIALERKRFNRSQIGGAIAALRQAADLLEGIE
jgi:hypothetical protein